ncbi:MAG: aminodeoxychorismate synthase component I [Microscillaceae bacterium]|nr:aminodeoxychorismate synthase component I [Microscillaceae bacterium]
MDALGQQRRPFWFMIDFLARSPVVLTEKELPGAGVCFAYPSRSFLPQSLPLPQSRPQFQKFPVDFATYQTAFEEVKRQIYLGNTYLLNLSFATRLQTNLSLGEIFAQSQAPFRLWIQHRFVCFSPEKFVRIQDGEIASFPMKGTIDAALPQAETLVLENPKEKAEHYTITDLIRNDLNQVAHHVEVSRFRYLDRVQAYDRQLLQVSSAIRGQLTPGYQSQLGQLLARLLPAGSITGAPKRKTLDIILAVENYNRGYYTGITGWFDGQNLESAVMIRFIEQIGDTLYFKSGGGITYQSEAEAEYQEMIDKVYLPFLPETSSDEGRPA